MQPLPLLICAQSGRFLAEAAKRAGYTVWVVDSFADQDTLAAADKVLQVTHFSQLSCAALRTALLEVSAGKPCKLIFGTGIERFYPLLNTLPEQIQYCGNGAETLEYICQPDRWFALLRQLSIAFPAVAQKTQPGFLFKAAQQWGGQHIQRAQPETPTAGYFQQFQHGQSGSVLFLADGNQAHWLSCNTQSCRNPSQDDFTLAAIHNRLLLTRTQRDLLCDIINRLTGQLQLCGLNALDFIVSDTGDIFVLELNARPAASAMLIDEQLPLIDWHLQACQGDLPDLTHDTEQSPKALHFCFSPADLKTPEAVDWPDFCHDLPRPGTYITAGAIVCSMVLSSLHNTQACHQVIQNLLQKMCDLTLK